MTGFDTREKVCPPLTAADPFTHPSLSLTEARVLRSAFEPMTTLAVLSCSFSRGMFHVTVRPLPNGAPTVITAPTMSQVALSAARIADAPTPDLTGQEAA